MAGPVSNIQWIPFTSPVDVPAFGVMISEGSITINGQVVLMGNKYGSGLAEKILYVNGPVEYSATADGPGSCAILADVPFYALCDNSVDAGDLLHPAANSWTLEVNDDGPLLALMDASGGKSLVIRHTSGDNLRLYQLTANLAPGGNANSNPVNGTTVDTSTTIVVDDKHSVAWGLKGERLWCKKDRVESGTTYVVPMGGGAPWYRMALSADLSAGSSANATITVRGVSVTVSVADEFLATGKSLTSGTVVGVVPNLIAGGFTVTEAKCP